MVDDFERMWSDLAPVGRSATTGGYFRQPSPRPSGSWTRVVPRAGARHAGWRSRTDAQRQPLAWWARRLRQRRGDRLATSTRCSTAARFDGPLGVVSAPRRRRPAPRPRRRAVAADRRQRLRRGGGVAVRARLPRLPPRDRGDRPGTRPGPCATATAYAWPRRCRSVATGGAARPARPASATFVELHVEQGRDLVDRERARRAWPAGSGRTAGGASTSAARRTTPAPPAWRTGATRCSPTRRPPWRPTRRPGAPASGPRSAASTSIPNGTNAMPSLVRAWLDARAESDEELARARRTRSSSKPTTGRAGTARP